MPYGVSRGCVLNRIAGGGAGCASARVRGHFFTRDGLAAMKAFQDFAEVEGIGFDVS